MRWAARRTTTLKEDKVYCLLGIFGVFLPLIYGEGEEYATQRLEEEIARRQKGQGTRVQHDLPGVFMLIEQHFFVLSRANDKQCFNYYLFQEISSSLDDGTSFSLLNKRSSTRIHTLA
jgi:hypothetical protein